MHGRSQGNHHKAAVREQLPIFETRKVGRDHPYVWKSRLIRGNSLRLHENRGIEAFNRTHERSKIPPAILADGQNMTVHGRSRFVKLRIDMLVKELKISGRLPSVPYI